MRVIGGTVPEPENSIWVHIAKARTGCVAEEVPGATRGSYAGCAWGAPWRSRYYVYAIDYDRGGEWMGQGVMCTRDKEFTIRGIGDRLARGYDRTGFFEVDTGGQRAWTVQLTESSEQSVQKPAPPGGRVSGAPSGGSSALPLPGGTPAIAVSPGRASSAPSLPPSGARTQ